MMPLAGCYPTIVAAPSVGDVCDHPDRWRAQTPCLSRRCR